VVVDPEPPLCEREEIRSLGQHVRMSVRARQVIDPAGVNVEREGIIAR
jgi:hypothetical protein